MREIRLTDYDLEKLASKGLNLPTELDVGPSSRGAYLNLSACLLGAFDEDELSSAVEDAVTSFFRERLVVIRLALAGRLAEAQSTEEENERTSSRPVPLRRRRAS